MARPHYQRAAIVAVRFVRPTRERQAGERVKGESEFRTAIASAIAM